MIWDWKPDHIDKGGKELCGDEQVDMCRIMKQLGGQGLMATLPESWLHPDWATQHTKVDLSLHALD